MEFHPVVQKVRSLLESRGISYDYFEHESVCTSEEASKVRPGYSLRQGAKALVVKAYLKGDIKKGTDGGGAKSATRVNAGVGEGTLGSVSAINEVFVMLVVPGDARFDGKKVKKALNAKDLRFATEEEVSRLTGGVQVGGVPPFGSLFGLTTYMDPQVLQNDKIIFNAGDRRVSIAISSSDYVAVENPTIIALL